MGTQTSGTAAFHDTLKFRGTIVNNKAMPIFLTFLCMGFGDVVGPLTSLQHKFGLSLEELGLWGTLFFFAFLMAGRFLGGVVLNWISAKRFLVITSGLSVLGVAGLYLVPAQVIGFLTISLIGLSFANIFPLIFSITVEEFPGRSNEISGLMVTAITGGAFVPLAFGIVADSLSLMAGFAVPLICILYIVYVSLQTRSEEEPISKPA